jgi:hypothetical protein
MYVTKTPCFASELESGQVFVIDGEAWAASEFTDLRGLRRIELVGLTVSGRREPEPDLRGELVTIEEAE